MRKMATDPANFPSLVDSLKFDCNWVGWERTCNLDQRASQAEGRGFESLLPLQSRSPHVARRAGHSRVRDSWTIRLLNTEPGQVPARPRVAGHRYPGVRDDGLFIEGLGSLEGVLAGERGAAEGGDRRDAASGLRGVAGARSLAHICLRNPG